MKKIRSKNEILGIVLIILAATIILDKLTGINLFKFVTKTLIQIVISVGALIMLARGFAKKHFGKVVLAVIILMIVNKNFLGGIGFGTAIIVVGLAFIGFRLITKDKDRKEFDPQRWLTDRAGSFVNNSAESAERSAEYAARNSKAFDYQTEHTGEGEKIKAEVCFNSAVKYITSPDFNKGKLECAFGRMAVYFDGVTLHANEANVLIGNAFGKMMVFIPKEWNVQVDTDAAFGSIREIGSCDKYGDQILKVKADCVFGSIEIHYV